MRDPRSGPGMADLLWRNSISPSDMSVLILSRIECVSLLCGNVFSFFDAVLIIVFEKRHNLVSFVG